MRKTYKIEVDCANCAAKIEDAVKKIDGIGDAVVNFMMQKIIIDFEDISEKDMIKEVVKTARKIERDFELYI
ncbi:MAG: cation transporter [Clostridia bacterium]|nr:cation transporter [Clostridia bacterium]